MSRWLYLLASLPVISDLIETGAWPARPRSWITEVTMGVVIAALVHHVRQTHAQLLTLTMTDPLTGLGNRREFIEVVAADCARSRRTAQPLTLVCIDLDNFKQVNDQAGHPAGDRVLAQLGAAIKDTLRAGTDHGFRLGGDEFAILLPGSSTAAARSVLERIRNHCAVADPLWVDGFLNISAGIVEFRPEESAFDFYHRADVAMYESKNLRIKVPPALKTPVIPDGQKNRFTVMD